ncbi:hypothetical protein [Plantactinospora sonchi]|uniref:Uncharacterized protein n=1 Tax=Plantactinospora sonchi TaxID=1544735 RepID=A0ABU7RMZ6_9ACTN
MRRIHHPDWRRLWRYCRCGAPWGCLDTVPPGSAVLAALDRLLNDVAHGHAADHGTAHGRAADRRAVDHRARPPNPGHFRQSAERGRRGSGQPPDQARGVER